MPFEQVMIENGRGQLLAARCDLPEGDARSVALFAHCFTCTKNLRAVGAISTALTDRGFAVLRFDFTGLGESEGEFGATNFTTNVSDLVAAAGHLKDRMGPARLLIGHSLGGAAVLQAAAQLDDVEAVATIGAPASPDHVVHLLQDDIPEIAARGEATVLLAGRPFRITKQFLDDLTSHDLAKTVAGLHRPLLVMHSPTDNTVGVENAGMIFDAARHPKSFVSLAEADHLLSDEKDALYVGAVIAAWADRYLG
ncbi:MAG: alpha/beta hydrolase [Acidimicrobiia bacterium]|nr:alpha/beta hydrolase [Acidimicrobiia bacterium]